MGDLLGDILWKASPFVVAGLITGIVLYFHRPVRKKLKPRAGVVAVYIERIRGGYIIRNMGDDGEMGLKNPENHKSQRMIFVSVEDAASMAQAAGWHIEGIIGEVECIKSEIGEL